MTVHEWQPIDGGWQCERCGRRCRLKYSGECKPGEKRPPARQPPPLLKKAANFGVALAKWAAAGFATRPADEINRLAAICRACEHFDPVRESCKQCGCPVTGPEKWRNKLAMETESCPVGKW